MSTVRQQQETTLSVLPSFKEIFSEWGNFDKPQRLAPLHDFHSAPSPGSGWGNRAASSPATRVHTGGEYMPQQFGPHVASPIPAMRSVRSGIPQHNLEPILLPPLRSDFYHQPSSSWTLRARLDQPMSSRTPSPQNTSTRPATEMRQKASLGHLSSDTDSDDDPSHDSPQLLIDEEELLSSGVSGQLGTDLTDHAKCLLQAVKHIQKTTTRIKPQRVCVSCGSKSTPQWRSGPSGRGTLCNACGLKERKRSKKAEQVLRSLHTVGCNGKNMEYAST